MYRGTNLKYAWKYFMERMKSENACWKGFCENWHLRKIHRPRLMAMRTQDSRLSKRYFLVLYSFWLSFQPTASLLCLWVDCSKVASTFKKDQLTSNGSHSTCRAVVILKWPSWRQSARYKQVSCPWTLKSSVCCQKREICPCILFIIFGSPFFFAVMVERDCDFSS